MKTYITKNQLLNDVERAIKKQKLILDKQRVKTIQKYVRYCNEEYNQNTILDYIRSFLHLTTRKRRVMTVKEFLSYYKIYDKYLKSKQNMSKVLNFNTSYFHWSCKWDEINYYKKSSVTKYDKLLLMKQMLIKNQIELIELNEKQFEMIYY